MSRTKNAGEGEAPKKSFDERMAELDQIVLEIEGGKLGLEPSLTRYQQGMQLYQDLKAEIEAHRKRFAELAADGTLAPHASERDAGEARA